MNWKFSVFNEEMKYLPTLEHERGKAELISTEHGIFFQVCLFVVGREHRVFEYLKKIVSLGSVENTVCDTISLSTTAFSIGQVCIAAVEPAQLWLMYVISVMLLYIW